jgi:uncharacterized protein (DUF433 family)
MVVRPDPPPNVLQMDETGTLRVAGTRITLDTLIGAYKRGDTPEEISEGFADLGLAVIYSVIAYYLDHQNELDLYLAQREKEAQELRQHFENDPRNKELRAKLIARRDARQSGS